MIELTRLNRQTFLLNADLIKVVEQSPDTVVTLLSGEKLIVLESAVEVKDRLVEFRREILRGLEMVNVLNADSSRVAAYVAKAAEGENRG